ncbi:MAG: hypothetical protein AAGA56_18425 [Myxococcota bacterium]
MSDKRIVVAAHGHCFDGVVSATLFTHLRETIAARPFRYKYKSCGYGPNMQTVPERWLNGHENAIVDFRFTSSRRLTWYFDHHLTAFSNDRQRDQALKQSKRYFFDPTYSSCTRLIADVGRERYGVDFSPFADLIEWADRIDAAAFESAREAIDRSRAVMRLAAIVEQRGNGPLYQELIPKLRHESVDDIMETETMAEHWGEIAAAAEDTKRRIAAALEQRDRVAVTDLSAAPLKGSGKFVSYALAPDSTYAVALIRMKQHYKISVGYNPWAPHPRRHDIASLCRRYGGGGHLAVGAISVPLNRIEEAKRTAEEVIAYLNGEPES